MNNSTLSSQPNPDHQSTKYALVLTLPLGITLRWKEKFDDLESAKSKAVSLPIGFAVMGDEDATRLHPNAILVPFKNTPTMPEKENDTDKAD